APAVPGSSRMASWSATVTRAATARRVRRRAKKLSSEDIRRLLAGEATLRGRAGGMDRGYRNRPQRKRFRSPSPAVSLKRTYLPEDLAGVAVGEVRFRTPRTPRQAPGRTPTRGLATLSPSRPPAGAQKC